jgi:hypothetical protein
MSCGILVSSSSHIRMRPCLNKACGTDDFLSLLIENNEVSDNSETSEEQLGYFTLM